MTTKLKSGDVLRVSASGGSIYLQYLGKHSEYGDAVAVCPAVQAPATAVTPDLFRDAYVTFYPAGAAFARGMVEVEGHLPSPGIPRRMRRAGARAGRRVETWVLEDAAGADEVRRELSEEERHLSIAAIWNHELLLQRVTQGWRPETEA
jgi:hypothetical protein